MNNRLLLTSMVALSFSVPAFAAFVCPDGYPYTDSSSPSDSEFCYRYCSASDFSHAMTVTGRDYYGGDSNDTCAVSSCESGWASTSDSAYNINLDSTISVTSGRGYAYIDSVHEIHEPYTGTSNWGDMLPWYYGLNSLEAGLWAVDYGDYIGVLVGKAHLSNIAGTYGWTTGNPDLKKTSELGTEYGTNCYCSLVKFSPNGFDRQLLGNLWVDLDSPWAYYGGTTNLDKCAETCASIMYDASVSYNLDFRNKLTNNAQPAYCQPNVITITWTNVNQNDVTANYAGTATYGDDVRTPSNVIVPDGKIFKGWKFSATAN